MQEPIGDGHASERPRTDIKRKSGQKKQHVFMELNEGVYEI